MSRMLMADDAAKRSHALPQGLFKAKLWRN